MSEPVKVNFLGDFTIEYNGKSIDDNSNRSHKVWSLLAYLIQNRGRAIPQEELISLLWGENGNDTDSKGALKAIFYRIRATLDKLETSAGHNFIVSRAGAYGWNSEYSVETDTDQFESLLKKAEACQEEEFALSFYRQAIELYTGSYLSKLSMSSWVIPLDVYYSRLYTDAVLTTLKLLEKRNLLDSVIRISQAALAQDPYNEDVYAFLLSALLKLGKRRDVAAAYETLREQLYATFSIQPSENLRSLYREAIKTINSTVVSPETLREQLREQDAERGAFICEYDFFKILYHATARTIARSGDVVHIALLTLSGAYGEELAKRSLDRAMDNLQEQLRINLRSGDCAARCSASQFVIMLHQSNYENSCSACSRIVKAYHRQYPHSPAELRFAVQPLEPML